MARMEDARDTYKPFTYPWAHEAWQVHEDLHWSPSEMKLDRDLRNWQRDLSFEDRNLIHQILRVFTQSDMEVAGNYADKFLEMYKNPEIQRMFLSFGAREGTHTVAYALFNDTLNLPDSDWYAFKEYEEMADKIGFLRVADVSTDSGKAIAHAHSAFAEGINLFAAFVMLLQFQRRGLMPGMCEAVRWSMKDETVHFMAQITAFRTKCEESPEIVTDAFKKQIYDLARKSVALEEKFIDLAYEMGPSGDTTAEGTKQYIRFIANRRLLQLGFKPIWDVESNPYPWVEDLVSAEVIENFFETRITEYSKAGMTGSWEEAWEHM